MRLGVGICGVRVGIGLRAKVLVGVGTRCGGEAFWIKVVFGEGYLGKRLELGLVKCVLTIGVEKSVSDWLGLGLGFALLLLFLLLRILHALPCC